MSPVASPLGKPHARRAPEEPLGFLLFPASKHPPQDDELRARAMSISIHPLHGASLPVLLIHPALEKVLN